MALTITATDTELQKPVNVVFEQTFLRRAQQLLPYFAGTVPGQINKGAGTSTIKWRRIEQETPSTVALAELTGTATYMQGRNADVPSFTDVVATVAKYGQFYIVNEEVDLFNPNGTGDELMAVLGESAGRSLNQLMRDIMEDNATQRFAGNVASDGAVVTVAVKENFKRIVNELNKNSARGFGAISAGSDRVGSTPILASFWGICHPDAAEDVAALTGFKSVESYINHTAIAPGEFGYLGGTGRGIRFIQTEDASVDASAGATGAAAADLRLTTSDKADLYSIVIYGMDSFGSVGVGRRHTDGVYRAGENQDSFELIHHRRGSGGTSDPFNEIETMAWKAWFAGAVLNATWSRTLRTGATNLEN